MLKGKYAKMGNSSPLSLVIAGLTFVADPKKPVGGHILVNIIHFTL
jgi:hypothetical protein